MVRQGPYRSPALFTGEDEEGERSGGDGRPAPWLSRLLTPGKAGRIGGADLGRAPGPQGLVNGGCDGRRGPREPQGYERGLEVSGFF